MNEPKGTAIGAKSLYMQWMHDRKRVHGIEIVSLPDIDFKFQPKQDHIILKAIYEAKLADDAIGGGTSVIDAILPFMKAQYKAGDPNLELIEKYEKLSTLELKELCTKLNVYSEPETPLSD